MCWKRRLKKRSSRPNARLKLVGGACILFLLICPNSRADKVSELQARFDKEPRATSKVHILDKLAEAQFEAASNAGKQGDDIAVGFTFEKYRDNIRTAFELLKKQEPDAERHPGGYRQLELQTRRGLREVEQTLVVVSPELRPPLEIVQKDILDIDDQLIRLLFPTRTSEPKKNPANPEGKQNNDPAI